MRKPLKTLTTGILFSLVMNVCNISHVLADPTGHERIVINVASRMLTLYHGDQVVREYPVGVGRPAYPTPLGSYHVIRKVVDPIWENPFKGTGKHRINPGWSNPLGTRWIGFHEANGNEFGIHGTPEVASVGQYSSHGCVRMQIRDAEELFEKVDNGTPVEVIYDRTLITKTDQDLKIRILKDPFGKGLPSVGSIRSKIAKQFPSAKIDDKMLVQAVTNPSETPVTIGKVEGTITLHGRVDNTQSDN